MRTRSLLLAGLLGIPAGPGCTEGAPTERPRNVLLITIDTLRSDHLGCYGGQVETPVVDALAARGIRFTDVHTTAPTTLPAHTSILTGTWPSRHGVRLNGRHRASPSLRTLAEVLLERGYQTGAFVSASVLDHFYGLDQGFSSFDDTMNQEVGLAQAQRRASEVTDAALQWLSGVREPFLLWIHYFDPHGPYDPPPPFDGLYYKGRRDDPENESMKGVPRVFYQKLDGITDVEYPRAQYKSEVAFVDASIGKLLSGLDAGGFSERTLIVVTADHGESLGEVNYWFDHGLNLHDVCLRVPLILSAPWLEGRRVVGGPASVVDIFPTILGTLGIDSPESDGIDLLPASQHGPLPARVLFFETFLPTLTNRPPLYGLQSGCWKITAAARSVALFDKTSDADDRVNLGHEQRAVLDELVRELENYLATATADVEEIAPSSEALEKLRALGYAK
ncbi:MAG: sulfatase [Planctomycetota bacterium]